ncbi:phosphopantetheine-binding protein [Streptomyces canus]|uniref:phosphopantetheine-binding protein n=1 Tax=Streptomyces TaxID=1883 RepID=UPI002E807F73|nr:phosphopantetheine-binding protein [Streptomyces sp. NBC_00576]WUB72089.1 phosphopantetheine-binding protein [Streptomyces sp. NBC_00576]
MNQFQKVITDVLSDHFKVDRQLIHSDATFADIRFDSLVLVELALVLENELDIRVADGELRDHMTIAEAAELVAAKKAVL